MRTTRWITWGTCAGLLLCGGPAVAQDRAPAAQTQRVDGDREFLGQALGVNELELQLAQLATERASTPELKAKARKMLENHTKLGERLSELAKQAGLSGRAELSADERATLARVAAQPAGSFDAVFKQTVDDGHVSELAMYQAEVTRAKDPQLRVLAEERVTALKQAVAGAGQAAKPMDVERR